MMIRNLTIDDYPCTMNLQLKKSNYDPRSCLFIIKQFGCVTLQSEF